MAHCNTILPQILKLVPRHEFEGFPGTVYLLRNHTRLTGILSRECAPGFIHRISRSSLALNPVGCAVVRNGPGYESRYL